jgi:hypothetical protein
MHSEINHFKGNGTYELPAQSSARPPSREALTQGQIEAHVRIAQTVSVLRRDFEARFPFLVGKHQLMNREKKMIAEAVAELTDGGTSPSLSVILNCLNIYRVEFLEWLQLKDE